MSKPAIIIVGGAWHTKDYLEPCAKIFQHQGYETKYLGLPSVGANPPSENFDGDVAAIRDVFSQTINQGKDVIAVLHSLSGIMGTQALHGLTKNATGGAGVIAIAYIASMVPKAGHGFDDHLQAVGDVSWKQAKEAFTQNGAIALPPDFALNMFYQDLPPEEGQKWAALLQPQSVGVYDCPLTHETYKEVPCGYMMTTQDNAFKHDYQLKTVEMRGFPSDRVVTLETGHNPWLTKPDEVKRFVLQTAGQPLTAA